MNIDLRINRFLVILPITVLSTALLSSHTNANTTEPKTYPVSVLSSDLELIASRNDRTRTSTFEVTSDAQLRISAMGRDYTLNLRNSQLLEGTQLVDRNGNSIARPDTLFLQGTVEGDPWSWVRGTWSDGQFTGWFFAFDQLLMIEKSTVTTDDQSTRTVMLDVNAGTTIKPFHDSERYAPVGSRSYARSALPYVKTPKGQIERTLRIGIVIDSHYNDTFNNNGLEKALSIINIINGIYQQELGVAIKLETAYWFNDPTADPLRSLENGIDEIMSRFREVRLSLPKLPADLTLVHLFTGLTDPKDVLGLGWIDVACRTDGYDVSVSRPYQFDALLTAHEIGHNLGAVHDNNLACNTENRKIMSARLSHTTEAEFSDCSREFMAPLIAATCNLDNLDLAIDLRQNTDVSRTGQHTEQVVSVVIQNQDNSREAERIVTDIRFSEGMRLSQQDSRCREFADRLECEIRSLTPGAVDELRLGFFLEQHQTGEITATLRPQHFSDVAAANNVASLSLRSANNESLLPETRSDGTRTGGSLAYLLWVLGVLALLRWKPAD